MVRTYQLRRPGLRLPLLSLLFRDGLVYYAVMSITKLLNFVLFWTAVTQANLVTLNWAFNSIITVIMVNRIVMNLREEGYRRTTVPETPTYNMSFMQTFLAGIDMDKTSGTEQTDESACQEIIMEEMEKGDVKGKGKAIQTY
ncbi:hypothetical protein K439DRAFT_82687 [Ramaria rubella]|nr:hypothetical protein K439DRAFT_82687 [Ramaria rubella]